MAGRLWKGSPAKGVGALLMLCACSNDLNALYARSSKGSRGVDAGMGAAAVASAARVDPYTAALELFGSDCARCIEDKCGDQARACADDMACAAEVTCRHACTDPPCNEGCDVGYAPGSQPVSPLAECAAVGCTDECPVGRDYSCVGAYAWPNPKTAVSALPLQLGTFATAGAAAPLVEAGIRVRACRSRTDLACSMSSEARSTAEGRVDLTLTNNGGDNTGYRPFDGFVAFDDLERDPPRIRPTLLLFDRSWPAPSEQYIDGGIDTLIVTPQGLFSTWSPGTGLIVAVVFDCRASNHARGIGLTLEVDAAPDLQPLYDGGKVTGRGGAAFVLGVPPGSTEVRARYGEQIITRMTVPVVADTVTYLWLSPSTRAL